MTTAAAAVTMTTIKRKCEKVCTLTFQICLCQGRHSSSSASAASITAMNSFAVHIVRCMQSSSSSTNTSKTLRFVVDVISKDSFWIDYSMIIMYRCLLCFALLCCCRASVCLQHTIRNCKQRQWQTTMGQQLNKHDNKMCAFHFHGQKPANCTQRHSS